MSILKVQQTGEKQERGKTSPFAQTKHTKRTVGDAGPELERACKTGHLDQMALEQKKVGTYLLETP